MKSVWWQRLLHRFFPGRPEKNNKALTTVELWRATSGTLEDRIYSALNIPPPPPEVVVDWNLAPEGFVTWRFHKQKDQAVWLTGRKRFEEYGTVWEAADAPRFGATEDMQITITPQQADAIRARKRAEALGEQLPAATPSVPRPRF